MTSSNSSKPQKWTDQACPVCLKLAKEQQIRMETVQRIPAGVGIAPISRLERGKRICFDCASAETLVAITLVPTFEAARVAVGNDRQEQYHLPGTPMGLVVDRLVRPSEPGDLEDQHEWLEANNWFNEPEDENTW